VKRLGVSILRYPGGNFSSGYNWKDGIGPKAQRPVRPELAWNDLETNRLRHRRVSALLRTHRRRALHLASNGGLGTVDDRPLLVEYTNESRHTYWADQRRKNGRKPPTKVPMDWATRLTALAARTQRTPWITRKFALERQPKGPIAPGGTLDQAVASGSE